MYGPNKDRVERLVRVVEGLTKAKRLSNAEYEGIWSSQSTDI